MMEDEVFRDAVSDVSPLPGKRRRQHRDKLVDGPTPAQLMRRDAAVGKRDARESDPNFLTLGEVPVRAPRELLEWKKDGVQREVFARLKAGKYPVDGSLDLHGHTVKEARIALFRFLNLAVGKRWRTVLIAHGRGEKSATPARIKSYVAAWLIQSPDVIAMHSALPNRGGTGAVYVMLRKSTAASDENREQHGGKSERGD